MNMRLLASPPRRIGGVGRVLWVAGAVALGGALACGVAVCDMGPALSAVRSSQVELLRWQELHPWGFATVFFALFTLLSALALPGCALLALAAGGCFGLVAGSLLVAFASTLGAMMSFLAARHFLREAVQHRWGDRLAVVEPHLARDGARYVFTLRVAPVIPFAVLNPLLGLSRLSGVTFFWASFFGMLAGSAAYVYAGLEMNRVASGGRFDAASVAALVLLAVLPWGGRLWAGLRAAVGRIERRAGDAPAAIAGRVDRRRSSTR